MWTRLRELPCESSGHPHPENVYVGRGLPAPFDIRSSPKHAVKIIASSVFRCWPALHTKATRTSLLLWLSLLPTCPGDSRFRGPSMRGYYIKLTDHVCAKFHYFTRVTQH